ncbi:hypothetical protein DSO57_1023222 [Entomophthora muscae]|uniref:Uncharacterized protein n=1 Tax=Entomophthora muscae TaxID=34485 RepID=A0ACC2TE02_9FUNG|nr:hypothetical protein DSO57_1023222 [Entomophthora muscae]
MEGTSRQPLLSSPIMTEYSITIGPSTGDPLHLYGKRKSEDELKALKDSGKSKAHSFYVNQNELIDSLLAPIGPDEDDSENLLKLKIAIYGSVAANVLLFLLQLYAAVKSGSLSLFATMADSFMDLLSSVILMLAAKAAESKNHTKYPTGKSRLETAGIIVFSSLMSTVSVQLMVEGIKSLISHEVSLDLDYITIGCVLIALGSKIFLYIYCIALSKYPSANILALDHRNDIIVNIFGLSMSLLGHRFAWWIDPVGCLLVALIILRSWVSTAIEHIDLIVGVSADPAFLNRLTYIAFTHDERIVQVDTCRAYHVGNNVFVEVDIVLDPHTPLHESHDIGETLQNKLEKLPEVERAFVHVDYESTHRPEH